MQSGMSIRQLHLRSVMSGVLHAAVWCALLVGVGYGQTSQDQVDEVLSPKVRSVIDSLNRALTARRLKSKLPRQRRDSLFQSLKHGL